MSLNPHRSGERPRASDESTTSRPFEAWAIERGSPSLIHHGETKGECDRVLTPHKTAIVARDGKAVAEKGRDKTVLKALRAAMEQRWRARGAMPTESPSESAVPTVAQGVALEPPRVRPRRQEPAPEPVDTPTATEPETPALAPPPPAEPPSPTEPEAAPVAGTPEATCSKCHAAPPGRPTVRTRAGEESWCVGCRRQSAPRSARREAPPRPVATSGREVTITLPADSEAARALAVADRVGGVDALERFIDLYLGFVEGA